jgi:hypothetical protein
LNFVGVLRFPIDSDARGGAAKTEAAHSMHGWRQFLLRVRDGESGPTSHVGVATSGYF